MIRFPGFAWYGIIYFWIAVFGIFSPAHAQERAKTQNWTTYHLSGPVHSVTWESASFIPQKDDWVKEKNSHSSYVEFDQKGNRILVKTIDPDGSFQYFSTETYNDQGFWDTRTRYSPDYSIQEINRFHYDDHGNEILQETFNPKKKLLQKIESHHNDKGLLTESILYDIQGSFQLRTTFDYDEKGNLIRKAFYRRNGTVANEISYEYDDSGKNVISRFKNGYQVIEKSDTKDEQGHVIEQRRTQPDGSRIIMKIGYDEHGRESLFTQVDENGAIIGKSTRTYEEDSHGNWIKMIDTPSESPQKRFINTRIITYYDEDKQPETRTAP